MFNELNNSNAPAHPAVDDIFAETDKPSINSQSDIETHRVGLANSGEALPRMEAEAETESPKKNYLKMLIIAVVALAILGGGYFTYLQFFKINPDDNVLTTTPKSDMQTNASTTPKANDTGFVNVIPETMPNPPGEFASGTDTAFEPAGAASTSATVSTSTEITPASNIDSDSDGLTDAEEKIAGTNINVIDTDNDGLSDYEEVIIYKSNPLNSDTDGDGYTDGLEVKGGFDPNVKGGKLPGPPPIK